MTRIGRVLQLYGQMVERQPYGRYTRDKKEMLANCEWVRRAEAWGERHVDAWGYFMGLYQ